MLPYSTPLENGTSNKLAEEMSINKFVIIQLNRDSKIITLAH